MASPQFDFKALKRTMGFAPVTQRTGKELKACELMRCPFPSHEDSTPSFGPYIDDDGLPRWKCFGCGWEGDAIDFIEKADGITKSEAIQKMYTGAPAPALPPAKEDPVNFPYTADQIAVAEHALLHNKVAQQFLASRGISLETAKALHIGYENGRVLVPTFVDGELVAVKLRLLRPPDERSPKWLKYRRDKKVYWLFNRTATGLADEVWITESELDAALLVSRGMAAVSVDSSSHRLTPTDTELLKTAKRVIVATDADAAGEKCAESLIKTLGAGKCLRVLPQGVKDFGELYAESPGKFEQRLKSLVRFAEVMRPDFTWESLLTEDEIVNEQGLELKYAVDKLIPLQRLTMFFGPEKSCKSLLAFYIGKCVANGVSVLDNFAVQHMPCLYLDAEDGIIGEYIGWLQKVGPELVRFRTLKTGLPALDDEHLLNVCRKNKPLLIVDSLHKFLGDGTGDKTNPWRSSDIEPVLQKLRLLTLAGATVIIIHHATKADPEKYRDSSAIGAGCDFMFAVVGEEQDAQGVKRVRMMGKPSRGAQPPSLNLIAFPALIDLGKFTLESDPPKTPMDRVVAFVAAQPEPKTKTWIGENMKGMRAATTRELLEEAVGKGRLTKTKEGKFWGKTDQSRGGTYAPALLQQSEAGLMTDRTMNGDFFDVPN